MRITLLLLTFYCFHLLSVAQEKAEVQTLTLENGLTVLLSENHELPQVFGMVVVNAGGKNDPANATGIAHYLEHMLFKGTTEMGTVNYEKEKVHLDKINELYEQLGATTDDEKRLAIQQQINKESIAASEYAIPNEIDKLLDQIGSTGTNAFTSEDITAYHNTFPSNQMERWLDLYSHRFEAPVFRLFQSELETVYEEKNRSMDNTFNQLFEKFSEQFYKVHPYGQQTVLGSVEHLKNPSLKSMYKFYDTYYVPNNMALLLVGDFETDQIIPLIKEKFGDWERKAVPEFPEYKEEEFSGREMFELKLTPIKVGIMGYRIPPNGHTDKPAMDVCLNLLSNYELSGLIDELPTDGEVMDAGAFAITNNDYSCGAIYFIPKVIGQKFEAAEELALQKLQKLKSGDFDDAFFAAAKLSLAKEKKEMMESNTGRAFEMLNCFTLGRTWEEQNQYVEKINALTKEEVVAIANRYFNGNYLLMKSKMGFPKKEKLDKPPFEPVIPKNETKSAYRKHFEHLPATKSKARFVDFNKEIETTEVAKGVTLHRVENPYNSIFSLEIHYGLGSAGNAHLRYLPAYMNIVGCDGYTGTQLRKALFKLGCSVWFESDEENLKVQLEGEEKNLTQVVTFLNQLLHKTESNDKKAKKIVDDVFANNKVERREPSHIANALQQYVQYGSNSSFQRELTKKQLKKLETEELLNALQEAMGHEATIYYTGRKSAAEVKKAFDGFQFSADLKPETEPVVYSKQPMNENKVYFVNRKDAVQSQLWFNVAGNTLALEDIPTIDVFNRYFGDNMSSLVFQEIREFRSLAYTARAHYNPARVVGKPNHFYGYIGCQADKTNDALRAMLNLIHEMPEKPEREELVKKSLVERAMSSRPGFRNLAEKVDQWKELGYTADPNQVKIPQYKQFTFDDIVAFHQKRLKGKPVVITIVGDKSRIDMDKLEEFGTVEEIKEKRLFVN